MKKKIASLYKSNYVNVLAYLLQASEYNALWYLRSYRATDDFNSVAKNMRPDSTQAYRAMKGLVWSILLFFYAGAVVVAFTQNSWQGALVAVGIVLMAPVLTAYVVVLPLLLADLVVRKPRENRMVKQATQIFAEHSATVIGVVGSYGKTTMKEILSEVLSVGTKVAATPGNYNTPVGVSRFAAKLKGDEDILIVEMGEYIPGDIVKICKIVSPDYAVVTGINEQHMQRMETIENIIQTIFEITDFVDKDKVLVNTESELVVQNMDEKNVSYSSEFAGPWKAGKVTADADGIKFTATKGETKLGVESSLIGSHQAGPLLAGVYLANRLGAKTNDIVKGISNTRPHGRRFNPRKLGNGATFIDDTYNGNPDGFLAGIDFLNNLEKTKTVYITAGIIELGEDKQRIHQMLGRELAKSKIDRILFIETPATEWMAEGFEEENSKKTFEWVNPDVGIYDHLEEFTSSGEIVLMQNWQREDVFYEL